MAFEKHLSIVTPDMVANGSNIRSTVRTIHNIIEAIPNTAWEQIDQPVIHGRVTIIRSSGDPSSSIRLEAYGFDREEGLLEDAGRRFVVITEYKGDEPIRASAIQYALGATFQGQGMPDATVFYYPLVPSIHIGYEGQESFPETHYAAGYTDGMFTHRTRNEVDPVTEVSSMVTAAQFMVRGGRVERPETQFCTFDSEGAVEPAELPKNVTPFRPSRRVIAQDYLPPVS